MSALAHKLIAENKASRSPFLDLGKCGLTELPQELAELRHLEVLVLSDVAYFWKEEKQKHERYESQNKGEANVLAIQSYYHTVILQVSSQTILEHNDQYFRKQSQNSHTAIQSYYHTVIL